MRNRLFASLVTSAALLTCGGVAHAQQLPPIPGETGTIVPEGGSGDKANEGAHTIIAGAADGILHLFHRPAQTTPGAEDAAAVSPDALKDFRNGTRIVVHYPPVADAEAREMNGVVTRVDREAKTIRIRLADGGEETLQLAPPVEADAAADGASDPIVYYTDLNGRRQAHYFIRQ